ncbi:hypothetical protein [Lactobacillus sp. HT06-2]
MKNMARQKTYIWCKLEFTDGTQSWYCISRVLRKAILIEKKQNRFWKNELINNYITVATTEYKNNRARLTVGKILEVSVSHHGTPGSNWTRNQFVTPEHLLNFKSAYNYLKHDYTWYNRLAIWVALRYWHNELKQKQIKHWQRSLGKVRGKVYHLRK